MTKLQRINWLTAYAQRQHTLANYIGATSQFNTGHGRMWYAGKQEEAYRLIDRVMLAGRIRDRLMSQISQ